MRLLAAAVAASLLTGWIGGSVHARVAASSRFEIAYRVINADWRSHVYVATADGKKRKLVSPLGGDTSGLARP
jgi:hypothetical protein